jgi:hypothetical protein
MATTPDHDLPQSEHLPRTPGGRIGLIVAGSLAAGLVAALALVATPFIPAKDKRFSKDPRISHRRAGREKLSRLRVQAHGFCAWGGRVVLTVGRSRDAGHAADLLAGLLAETLLVFRTGSCLANMRRLGRRQLCDGAR